MSRRPRRRSWWVTESADSSWNWPKMLGRQIRGRSAYGRKFGRAVRRVLLGDNSHRLSGRTVRRRR